VDSSKPLFCHRFLTFTVSFKGLQMGEIFPRARSVIAAFDHRFGYSLGHGRDTNRSMLQYRREAMKIAAKGEARVLARPNCAAALAALTIVLLLTGCADDNAKWFAGPNPFNTAKGGYTYSSLGETRQDRPITQNDLIDANGACPNYVPAAPSASANPGAGAPPSPDTAALLGGGVALGMSECDVVTRLGQPTAVNPGNNTNGSRSLILTYKSGPRPGVYRFEGGRLSEMDRVEAPPAAPEKKTTRKKPATSSEQSKAGDKS
jgi:hypothetical protein